MPGSLKTQTNVYKVELKDIRDTIDLIFSPLGLDSRRWLQKGEAPYPGYCRAPGSGACLPLICNCKKLLDIWIKINKTQSKLKGKRTEKKWFGLSEIKPYHNNLYCGYYY